MLSAMTKRWDEHCRMAAEFASQKEEGGSLPVTPALQHNGVNSLTELGALVGERATTE